MTRNLVALAGGLVFAIGLGLGGMTLPSKIVGFLDFSGAWDASLALVMGGAVMMYSVIYRVAIRRSEPILGGAFSIPSRRDLDSQLIAGAALFGIGWGIGGFCPGPAIVSLAWLDTPVLTFVVAMCVGMLLHGLIAARAARPAPEAAAAVRADA